MNLILIYLAILQICAAQDYVPPTYNPNQPNDYLNNDPRYDNPYDPNKRYQNKDQYEPNRNKYDLDQRYNQNSFADNTPRPAWDSSRTYSSTSYKSGVLEHDSVIIHEATYFIVASRMVRPGQIYKISANILKSRMQMTIRASISCNGVEIADVTQPVKEGVPEILNMRFATT